MTTIAGLFRQWDNAAHAVDLLSTAGYNADQISLIVPKDVLDKIRRNESGRTTPAAVNAQVGLGARGAGVVGGFNNMLSGSTPLAVAGLGSVLFSGPLSPGSRQAAAGKEVTTQGKDVVQSLVDAGIPSDRAELFAEGVKRGGILVAVEAEDRMAEAINLLNQANASDVEALGREWRREGWQGFVTT
jgi:hypothetical protein